ncbi:PKD domain-containing protein [Vibrio navarrensis]|uniref:PKD domain-containing protein n=1 Tax=Vibrio navarrensis TaxID=29495 RepID=A0A099LNB9_9VIBR|nr:hypothetical protein [Vibrio navarrensis]KGK08866.1 hypothetical protein EA26_16705 [Vibrio navarrensis]MBE4581789.1 hypothetical protein [Vibrio navarrensis]MBE4614284.1 hypothetical protein [Vibrio navarrensis]QOD70878.1 hypothetical protein IF132_19935 [Vibrio navarrensis]
MFKSAKIILMLGVMALVSGCDVDDVTDADKLSKPTVNAGSDQLLKLPLNSITLAGSAKSFLSAYKIKTTSWSQIAGPQQLALLNADKLTATALYPTTAGTYIFQLYAKDTGGRSNTDQVKIIIEPATQASAIRRMQSNMVSNEIAAVSWQYGAQNQGVLVFGSLGNIDLSELKQQLNLAIEELNSAAELSLDFSQSTGGDVQTALQIIETLSQQDLPVCLQDKCSQLYAGYLSERAFSLNPHCNSVPMCVAGLLQERRD